jgi:hypothetical protein
MRITSVIATAIVMVMLGAGFSALSMNASAAQSGADSYGYAYTDSKSPEPSVTFSWVDIIGTGTPLPLYGDDEYGGPYAIGFDFLFYGETYSMFNISTNGLIAFGPVGSSYYNDPIPVSYSPNNYIAPYWDDLVVDSDELIIETMGAEPDRRLVIEWVNVNRYVSSNLMTFEVILEEATGHIWFQYATMNGMTGDSATVGIENPDGTVGVQYGYNQAVLEDGLAVRFSRLPVAIGPSQSEEAPPGSTVTYELVAMNLQPLSDTLDIAFTTVEGWPVSLFNESMNPLVDTDTDGVPDVGELPAYGQATLYVSVQVPEILGAVSETTTVSATSSVNPLVSSTCPLTTSLPPAWFEQPHSDYGYDSDDDGLYDYLVVEISVYARVAGWYYVYGDLRTTSNLSIGWAGNSVYVDAGATVPFELEYHGYQIRVEEADGPYGVMLFLYDDYWVERCLGWHETSSYLYTDFAMVPGELVTPFTDEGVDEDLDGLYDYLRVDVQINVNRAGNFFMGASLFDSDWTWLEDIGVNENFPVGLNTARFDFDPWTIRSEAIDGVFHFEIHLEGEIDGDWLSLDYGSHTTGVYETHLFERAPAVFESPHGEHTVDDDTDFLWDALVVEANLNVTVEADYTVQGIMRSTGGDHIDTVTLYEHLEQGLQTVELPFPGFSIWYWGYNDQYSVELIVSGGGKLMDTDSYLTQTYTWEEFEGEVARFDPPHSSYVLDTDSDSLYDLLVVETSLNVSVSGTYEIFADLYSPGWSYLGEARTSLYLSAGVATAELAFAGWLLYYSYQSGNFNLEFYLYDSCRRYIAFGAHTTGYYEYTGFETFPAEFDWPNHGFAWDDDHDSLYDRYVANLTVVVHSAGTFLIEGFMYDEDWSWFSSASESFDLEEGTQTVQISFPAWVLYSLGQDSSFYLEFVLHDSLMNVLSITSFWSSWYEYEDFLAAPPGIESVLAESSPVVDGVMGSSEWSDAVVVALDGQSGLNEVPASLLVMNDAKSLYICIDAYGDTSRSTNDVASLAFDTGDDGVRTNGEEDEFWMGGETLYVRSHLVYNEFGDFWQTHCSPFDEVGLMGAVGFEATSSHLEEHRIYEFAIPLDLLGVSPGETIGFFVGSHYGPGVYDGWTGAESRWPPVLYTNSSMAYSELLLAAPVVIPPPITSVAVAGTAGNNNWYHSGVNVTLSASGGDGGIDYTEYRLDGGPWTTYTVPISIQAEGTHTLEYRSVDNAANVEPTRSTSIKIDRVAPITTSAVSGSHVWLNATDATSGLAVTMYRVDGGAWNAYLGSLDISAEGTHTVEFYSTDLAGNVEETQSLEVEGEGGAGILADMNFYMVLAIIAIIVLISIGAIFGMKRKAKDAETKHVIRDMASPVAQMQDDNVPPPVQQEPTEPPEPPKNK